MDLNSSRVIGGVDWASRYNFGDSTILFDGIEPAIEQLIAEATTVQGCVAWLTAPRLLERLQGKKLSLIVQNDRMFYPNKRSKKALNISSVLERRYLALESKFEHPELGLLDPIRIYGSLPKKNEAPRLHHKFLILNGNIVLTGSFNLTTTASRSLENVIIVRSKEVARAYLNEYEVLLNGSKRLHWFSKDR